MADYGPDRLEHARAQITYQSTSSLAGVIMMFSTTVLVGSWIAGTALLSACSIDLVITRESRRDLGYFLFCIYSHSGTHPFSYRPQYFTWPLGFEKSVSECIYSHPLRVPSLFHILASSSAPYSPSHSRTQLRLLA